MLTGLLIGAATLSGGRNAFAEPYKVQPGDSLSLIAQQHGITQGVILALNPKVISPDRLFSGQLIDLPDNAVYLPTLARITHTVAPGETLSGVAALYDATIADLLTLNPQLRLDVLWIGTELVIRDDFAAAVTESPAPKIEPTPAESEPIVTTPPTPASVNGPSIGGLPVVVYRVESGDTFTRIAQRFSTTVETLIVFNPSVRPDRLFIDAILWVPKQPGSLEPITARPSPDALLELPTIPYLVVAGDSANLIAQRNDLTLEQLERLNADIDLSRIFVGQFLLVPGQLDKILTSIGGPGLRPEPSESVAVREFTVYIVAPGDSGYALAAAFELDLPQLESLNPDVNFGTLLIGETLVVPKIDRPPPPPGTAPAGPAAANVYTVVPGDNLSAIALRFETTTNTVLELNTGLDPNLLRVDQELRLPGTMPLPVVARSITLDFSGDLESVAANVGVLPHTLLANNPRLTGGWITAGTTLQVPIREGVLVTVQPGDTLLGIAQQFGSSVERLAGDPTTGVIGPNQLVVGQQLVIPITLPLFAWPFFDSIVTDGFGLCRTADCSVVHHGVDLSQGLGSSVGAIADGTVTFVGGSYCCGLGFHVKMAHANGFESLYGHLKDAPPVLLGQTVTRGDIIGYVGTTGFSTGPHLHLELRHNGWYLNALNYLP